MDTRDMIMFGRRELPDGSSELVFIDDIPLEDNGRRCNLTCSKCGGQLEAVRKHKDDIEGGFAFLRHAAGENKGCVGHAEGVVHSLAKKLLLSAKGQRFMLPPVFWKDGTAHISRYTSTGKWRSFRSNRTGWSFLDHNKSANAIYSENIVCEIIDVEEESNDESSVPKDMRADVVLTLKSMSGTVKKVAVEIRDSHPKDIEDVTQYARAGMSVMEISVGDLDPKDRHLKRDLWQRVLGIPYDKSSQMREWLYNDAVGKHFDNYMCWRITNCSDEKLMYTLRHYLNILGLGHLTQTPYNAYKDNDLQWKMYNIAKDNNDIVDKHMWCYDKINDNIMYLKQADSEVTFSLCYDKEKDNSLELNNMYDLEIIRWLVEEICSRTYIAAHDRILSREETLDDFCERNGFTSE